MNTESFIQNSVWFSESSDTFPTMDDEELRVDNVGLSYVLGLANAFGFRPARAAWTAPLKNDYTLPDWAKTWELGFRVIGRVEDEEATAFSRALAIAAEELQSGANGVPNRLSEKMPNASPSFTEWARRPESAALVRAVSRFASRGGFRVTPERNVAWQYPSPKNIVLHRGTVDTEWRAAPTSDVSHQPPDA